MFALHQGSTCMYCTYKYVCADANKCLIYLSIVNFKWSNHKQDQFVLESIHWSIERRRMFDHRIRGLYKPKHIG